MYLCNQWGSPPSKPITSRCSQAVVCNTMHGYHVQQQHCIILLLVLSVFPQLALPTILLSSPSFAPCNQSSLLTNCTNHFTLQASINLTAETQPITATATIRCIDRHVGSCAWVERATHTYIQSKTTPSQIAPCSSHSPTGECPCPCDYALDEGCTCRDIAPHAVVNVTVRSTAATAVLYNFSYAGVYNGKPSEVGLQRGFVKGCAGHMCACVLPYILVRYTCVKYT